MNIVSFTVDDRRLCKRFVDIHWRLYAGEPNYVPLLDYEYLGFHLIGMNGYFDRKNPFFRHGDMRLFIAEHNGRDVGRVCAYVNHDHNAAYNDKTGFFAFFECDDNPRAAGALLNAAGDWLRAQGMTQIRGPHNLPVNESTPGTLVEGFDAVPVIYYHYNHPYFAGLFEQCGMNVVKRVTSMDVPIYSEVNPRLERIAEFRKKKHSMRVTNFAEGDFTQMRKDMLDIYNDAWGNNWGFVPFREEDFFANVNDMRLIWDPRLMWFVYVGDEPAALFGVVPNILDRMKRLPVRNELLRAARMILTKNRCNGIRLGYFGIKHKFRCLGIDALMYVHSKKFVQSLKKFAYCHVGWVLEDNELMKAGILSMDGVINRVYAVYQKDI